MARRNFRNMFLVAFFFTACINEMSHLDFEAWWKVHSKDFIVTKRYSNVTFSAGYIPPEYFLAKNDISLREDEDVLIGIELRYYIEGGDDLYYHQISDEESLNRRIDYFQNAFKEGCLLFENDNKFLVCHDVHVERTSGITPYTAIMLYFITNREFEMGKLPHITFQFTDEVFNNGIVKFKFNDLDEIPTLKVI